MILPMLKTPVFIFLILSSSAALALTTNGAKKISTEVERIIAKSGVPREHLGLFAAFDDEQLISLNSEKKFIPASITKIITAASTIRHFPPGFRFKTSLLSAGKIEGQTLKGDLVLLGGGDPSFVSENLWYLVNAFLRNEIKKIEGDIIVDDSLFDNQRYDLSRQKERVDRAYDAPVGAMSFNWNSVNIFVRPGNKVGEPAKVWADPENEYISIKNLVKTSTGKTAVAAERDGEAKDIGDLLIVTGSIGIGSKELVIYKNITQPNIWSGYNLKSFLAQRGIQLTGKVRSGVSPAEAKVLAQSESKAIQEVLADMNKFSNNYIAEMLTKDMAAYEESELQQRKMVSLEQGMAVLRKGLNKIGLANKDFDLVNPSGLTRENRVTAQLIYRVLNDVRSQFIYQPEFMSSLPIAGIDGTLKNRFKGGAGERWIRAKTGYLNGVVSLAGFAGRRDGSEIPFAFIYNGGTDESRIRTFFDKLATALAEVE